MRARGIFGWSRWRCCKDYRQQGAKQFWKIRIAREKGTKSLSKIYLRRQSRFTKSERLCSINVVLSYWLERPGKLNFHQSFNAVDRETFRRDKTSGYMRMLSGATLALSFFLVIFRFLDNIISLHSLRSFRSARFARSVQFTPLISLIRFISQGKITRKNDRFKLVPEIILI